MDEWKEVSGGSYVAWDSPKEVVGRLIELQEVDNSRFGDRRAMRVRVEKEGGEVVWFFAPAMLASRLREIPLGSMVRVVYTGKYTTSSNNRPVKEFRVYVKAVKA
ncbi:MAG: hypothetical protein QN144_10250 [Armatimonadota bacterium]|nr:hypothetical protein [Armatimonadota bacterium]